jgi:hypothetical protein
MLCLGGLTAATAGFMLSPLARAVRDAQVSTTTTTTTTTLAALARGENSVHENSVHENSVQGSVDFNRDVRPILSDRCFGCHGPDAEHGRRAGLRLDTEEGSRATLPSGARAIVPGDLDASEAVERILSDDPDDVMPPPELKRPLTEAERDILVRWIAEGAKYAPHWAFVAPRAPARVASPAVPASGSEQTQTTWPRDPFDGLMLERMTAAGLTCTDWAPTDARRGRRVRRRYVARRVRTPRRRDARDPTRRRTSRDRVA